MYNLSKYLGFVGVVVCAGCHSVGPKSIEKYHPQYNNSLVTTMDKQLLTNIVRLKYRENPLFLEVSSITDSFENEGMTGLKDARWFPNGKASASYLTSLFTIKDIHSPTISYRPVKGKEFIKHMMTPIPLNIALGLSSSGWKLERVFNTCIERLNDLENAPNASGPTPYNKPSYEKFYEMTALLRRLESEGAVMIGVDPENGKNLLMRIHSSHTGDEAVIKFKDLLGLERRRNEFRFEDNFLKISGESMVVRTRSLMGVLFYLSHAVEVPAADVEAGLIQRTFDAAGNEFDWSRNASGTLMKIHCSEERPKDAFIETNYRGHWFFIKNSDLHSKSTFMFISTLFDLQAGEASSSDVAPMLTIPVGR